MRTTNQLKPQTVLAYAMLIIVFVAVLVIGAMSRAHADGVYTCIKPEYENTQYSACGTGNTDIRITSAPKPTDLVVVAAPNVSGDRRSFWYAVPAPTWQKWSNTTADSIIGICGGNETSPDLCAAGNGGNSALKVRSQIVGLVQAPPANAWKFKELDCTPNALGEIRFGWNWCSVSGLIHCDLPQGVKANSRSYGFCGLVSKSPEDFAGLSKKELMDLDAKNTNRAPTDAEWNVIVELDRKHRPVFHVVNPGYSDAPTYTRNTDGTRSSKATRWRAPVGWTCDYTRRLVGTDYFVAGTDPLTNDPLYAKCKLVSGLITKP